MYEGEREGKGKAEKDTEKNYDTYHYVLHIV